MKIQIISDIHLEFAPFKLENTERADVLVLAGDILPVALVNGELKRPNALFGEDWPIIKNGIHKFFNKANTAWKRCYMVFGNHEYYHGDFRNSLKMFQQWLDFYEYNNVILMDNSMEVFEDITFIGTTLWTDMNKGNPLAVEEIKWIMYDYRAIGVAGGPLTVEDTMAECNYAKQYLMMSLMEAPTDKKVVITHHAPTYKSVNKRFYSAGNSNYAFFSQLDDIILEYTPTLWIHGHMHDSCDYTVEKTRVVCNPRGYSDIKYSTQQENKAFNKNFALIV